MSLTDEHRAKLIHTAELIAKHGQREAAKILNINRGTLRSRMETMAANGIIITPVAPKPEPEPEVIEIPQERDFSRPLIKNPPPVPASVFGAKHVFTTKKDHTYTFGALGDSHLGSKYERLDVLNALYDAYEEAGISEVFHTGNWIDGEFRFNIHDIHKHGMDSQCRYLAQAYPQRKGITTYAVTGDDHEGWYAQRTGVDIGLYAENTFRKTGRTDWVDLGYMDAPIIIRDKESGADAVMSVAHPGGGSAYALSYAIQKIIEVLEGGEKPAIGLYGHYHKLMFANIRNVWCVQTGSQKDVDTFCKKMKIDVHVGGTICKATLDPDTGAVVRLQVELLRYFNRAYYGGRWSPHGDVVLPERTLGGV